MELQNQYTSVHSNFNPSYNKKVPVTQKRHKRKKEKVSKKLEDDDDVDDIEERKRKNQQYMNVLHDLARLRDHYYSVYLSKLEAKVQKQRKELKAREEKIKLDLIEKEAEKAKKAHRFTHRLPKVKVTNDLEYLRQVPKSRYYHLVAVEELMKSRGLLKKQFEVEKFWQKARKDEAIWHRPLPATLSPDRLTEYMVSRYSSQTIHSKTDQSTLPGNPLFHTVEPLPGILKKSMENSDEEVSLPEERSESPPLVFPEQPKFPKLHSFNKNLFTKSSYPASVISTLSNSSQETGGPSNPKANRKKMEHHLKKDAYDVAVVNRAMARRLMQRHGGRIETLKPISEITEMWCTESETSSQTSKTTKSQGTVARRKLKAKTLPKTTKIEPLPDATLSAIQEQADDTESACEPLSMNMMITSSNVSVKDVKSQNPIWINYVDVEDETID